MARLAIPYNKYQNKKASLLNGIGLFLVIVGIIGFSASNRFGKQLPQKTADLISALTVAALFGGLAIIGIVWLVMRNLAYRNILQIIREKNLEPILRSSVTEAVGCYRLLPTRKMEQYLKGLNPEAGVYIAAHRAGLRKK